MGGYASIDTISNLPARAPHIVSVGPTIRQSVNTHGIEVLRPWETTDNIAQGLLRSHRAPCTGVAHAADGTHVEVVGGVGCEVVNDNERLACGGSGCFIDKGAVAVGKTRGTVLNLIT